MYCMGLKCEAYNILLSLCLHLILTKNVTLCSQQVKEFVDDNLQEVAEAVLAAYDSGDLQTAIDGGHDTWKKWVNSVGKSLKRKVRECSLCSSQLIFRLSREKLN